MTNHNGDTAPTPPSAPGDLVFPSGSQPSHVQISIPDRANAHAPNAQSVDEDPQVIGRLRPSGPTGLRRVDSLDELATLPDGTVVVWHDSFSGRQAGLLVTGSVGNREIQPVSLAIYESNTDLSLVTPPAWVLTFNDPGT